MRTGRFFWGFVVIIIGVLLLLEPIGILPQGTSAWKFIWPSLVILLGVWFLIVPMLYRGKKLETETLSIPLEEASKAKIRLKHGAGQLVVNMLDDPQLVLSGKFGGGIDQSIHRDEDAVKIKLRTPTQMYSFPYGASMSGLNWEVNISKHIPVRLDVDSGASETRLNLTELKISELNINTGASSTEVKLPASAGFTRVRIESGAASVVLRVPEGVAARIGVESGLAGITVDRSRFPKVNGAYESPDYDQAPNKLDIFVKTGVGSLEVH